MVHTSLPHAVDASAQRALLDPEMLSFYRAQLARALHTLRVSTAAVVDGISRWRAELQSSSGYYAALPEHEIVFFYAPAPRQDDVRGFSLPARAHAHRSLLLDWFVTSCRGSSRMRPIRQAGSSWPGAGGDSRWQRHDRAQRRPSVQ